MTRAPTIAALGDTHDVAVDREAMLAGIRPWLDGVSRILHTGDVTSEEFLDALEQHAPVVAVRSGIDPDLPPRLTDGPRSIEVEGCRIELIRTLDGSEPVPRDDVDLVVHGGTHEPAILTAGATLYLNPGAPAFSETPSMALIHVEATGVRLQIVPLPHLPRDEE